MRFWAKIGSNIKLNKLISFRRGLHFELQIKLFYMISESTLEKEVWVTDIMARIFKSVSWEKIEINKKLYINNYFRMNENFWICQYSLFLIENNSFIKYDMKFQNLGVVNDRLIITFIIHSKYIVWNTPLIFQLP